MSRASTVTALPPASRRKIWPRAAGACMLAAAASPWCLAGPLAVDAWRPSGVFIQGGIGRDVASAAIGASWDWQLQHEIALGRVTGATEVLLGDWHARTPSQDFTQVGIAPVLRLYPRDWDEGWFVEGGIGGNVITPKYRNYRQRFGSTFNFSVPFGMGRRFGAAHQHEVVVRVVHFSNGGLRQPNPGENFGQVRYTRRF